jgi:hypothetical protein
VSIRKKMEEINSGEQAWTQIRKAALSSLESDRRALAVLPDGMFSTADAQRIWNYASGKKALERLGLLECAGLVVRVAGGGRFVLTKWRKAT